LSAETHAYVPKLLALAAILSKQNSYYIDWPKIPNRPYLAFVDVNSQLDLTKAAKVAGISMTEFYQLNPGFNRSTTDPNGFHHIVIPADKEEKFRADLAGELAKTSIHFQKYQVRRKDNLQKIAAKFNTTLNELRKTNELVSDDVYVGQSLLVPMGKTFVPAQKTSRNYLMSKASERDSYGRGSSKYHIVKAGETLYGIAKKYKVTVKKLMEWNNMTSKSLLKPGQKLALR
jgi:membrane-bound lytic murein transglycosylase D